MATAPTVLDCPVCGKQAERQMSAGAGLVFHGSGFYITDYGKDGKKDQKPASSRTSDSSSAASPAASGDSKSSDSGSDSSASTSKAAESQLKEAPKAADSSAVVKGSTAPAAPKAAE